MRLNTVLAGVCQLVAMMFSYSAASAAPVVIENETLSVAYDGAAAMFSAVEKASRAVVVQNGRLDAATAKAVAEDVTDAVFGTGRRIVIAREDGGSLSLELYRGVPFVFLRGRLHNGGNEPMEVAKVAAAAFSLDLGKPVESLRTLGTAGLTAPDKHPGSYLLLTLADPATRRGVVAGWLTNDRGSGVVFSKTAEAKTADASKRLVEFRAQIDYGRLRIPAGESADLETLLIGIFDDARIGEELFADALARQHRVKLRPEVAGYCTWYSDQHAGAGDEKSIVELGEFVAKELKPFGFSFLQMDDQWQDGKEYNGPRRGFERVRPDGPYQHGIKPVADRLQNLGLTTGIWFMPFARHHQAPDYQDRQHWFVKRLDNGKPYETPWGGTSLDLTHPEVQAHVASLIKTIHSWGVNYFKMDGLWTGSATEQIYVNDGYRDDHIGNNAPFHDPAKTNLEMYRDGLKLVREAAGPEVFLSGCNVSQNMRSLGGSIGLVDSMRIGPDNGQGWGDYRKEIEKSEAGTIITGPIRGSRLYFLNGRVWWNDPDPTYVRNSIPLKHARLITSWVALSGAFYLNSDWIPALSAERLDIIKRTIPAHGATARPVDYFDTPMPSIWLVTDDRQTVRRQVLGLFNWDDQDRAIACTAAKAGVDASKPLYGFDFWANKPTLVLGADWSLDVPGQSCRVIALRPAEGHPVLVSTSRHVTQGIVDVTNEQWNPATQELTGTSAVVGNDPYELRIAGMNDGGPWKLVSVTVSSDDAAAGVAIAPREAAGDDWAGWRRVGIDSKQNRSVRWTLKFAGL